MRKNKTLRQITDKIILSLIYLSTSVTVLILIGLIAYITVKGLYRENRSISNILKSDNIVLEIDNEELMFITDKKIKRDSINIIEVEKILNREIKNWSSISESRAKLNLITLSENNEKNLKKYKIKNVNNTEELLNLLNKKPGTIGIVPFSIKDSIDLKGLKILNIDSKCIAAGYKVSEIIDNKKLSVLSEKNAERLADGNVKNWKEVGGYDVPLTLLSTAEEVKNSSGGYAVVDYTDALNSKVNIIPVSYIRKSANFSLSFLFDKPVKAGKAGGISTIIINTFFMIMLTMLFSVPVGVGAAVYLNEYASPGKVMRIIRLGVETLAGIPSIIFGLFGFIFFVDILKLGIGLLSGSLTTAMMIIPVIVRTSEEALRAVPAAYREGSLALGAGLWYTVKNVVLPAAKPGILSGIILSIGRALGETAALVFTMGFDYRIANGIKSSARVLSVHLYQLVREGISFERAFATAFVLMIFIFVINTATVALVSGKDRNGE